MNIIFLEWKNYGSEDVAEAFAALSINMRRVEFAAMHDRVNADADMFLDNLFEERFPDGKGADCVFTFNYSPLVSNACKRHDLKYIAWVYDSPLVSLFSYTVINPCNYVFVFDGELFQRFRREGITTVHYMPLAANVRRLDAMKPGNAVTGLSGDISFVGAMYNEKHNLYDRLSGMSDFVKGYLDGAMAAQMKVQGYYFIEELLKGQVLEEMKKALEYKPNRDGVETAEYVYSDYFIARKIAGLERKRILSMLSESFDVKLYTYNPTPELPKVHNMGAVDYYDTMPYIFKCSRINLNISLRSIRSGIPLRCMDIMGAGGFLLTNYQEDMLRHFVPGEDFVYYESDEDLMRKCEYYLGHDEERERIAQNGYNKVKTLHSYEDRIKEMLTIAGLAAPV